MISCTAMADNSRPAVRVSNSTSLSQHPVNRAGKPHRQPPRNCDRANGHRERDNIPAAAGPLHEQHRGHYRARACQQQGAKRHERHATKTSQKYFTLTNELTARSPARRP